MDCIPCVAAVIKVYMLSRTGLPSWGHHLLHLPLGTVYVLVA